MYTNVSASTIRNGNAMKATALHRWAAESAVADHGLDPSRVAVVPFGANMEVELTAEEAEAVVAARPDDSCRLLFVGVE